MTTLKEQIIELAAKKPGLTDREVTDRLRGRNEAPQPVNQACRQLEATGVLKRRRRHDNLIGNYPTGAELPAQPVQKAAKSDHDGVLSEDEVKAVLQKWLEADGWTTEIAWGRTPGIDIDARRGEERWIIEVKGPGSRQPMRVNYFIGILGETLQRMDDPHAQYSIAFPDMQQYQGLWERLPALAKERTEISVLFVKSDGRVIVEK